MLWGIWLNLNHANIEPSEGTGGTTNKSGWD